MFNINIANERLYNENFESSSHDLMTEHGIMSAYKRVEEINDVGDTFIIVEIENEWNYWEGFAYLDEIVETAEFIQNMDEEQQNAFKAIAEKDTECPSEIANKVFHGTLLTMEDVKFEHEDNIWRFFVLSSENVALTY